jgi:hypothetical protein
VYAYLSKESPEFSELVCLNKHQHDFCFVLNFEFPKILVKTWGLGKKGKHTQRFLAQWFCKYKGVLSMLFA